MVSRYDKHSEGLPEAVRFQNSIEPWREAVSDDEFWTKFCCLPYACSWSLPAAALMYAVCRVLHVGCCESGYHKQHPAYKNRVFAAGIYTGVIH